ncbi:MAG TPA: anthranilate phosphoribosyltransferase [Bryobacteraceae bacterium]|jgi:anthranilate phosphoribosyltransferase|nr:anthranilate phosphoribosyltransferase [Bryobacteraceae bacterium]
MLSPFLHKVSARQDLSAAEAREAMIVILSGQASTPEIAALLVGLRTKGETSDELLGFARAMREKSASIDVGLDSEPLLDTCGTGGDGGGTFNISTVAAFVVAGAGVRVAKHGNRSFSSRCGSADILEQLGVHVSLAPDRAAQAIREIGIGFLFAPLMHPAMKHAQPARVELKTRTVFNLLGPLTNPARATRQLIGAPSAQAAELMANALAGLHPERAFIVHGSDGLDEVTTTGSTLVFEVTGADVRSFQWTPADFGISVSVLEVLRGGDRACNAAIATAILKGQPGAPRDVVLVNSAAALLVAGGASDLDEAMKRAAQSIDSGAAWTKLQQLAEFSCA